jgi:hypothetical protein
MPSHPPGSPKRGHVWWVRRDTCHTVSCEHLLGPWKCPGRVPGLAHQWTRVRTSDVIEEAPAIDLGSAEQSGVTLQMVPSPGNRCPERRGMFQPAVPITIAPSPGLQPATVSSATLTPGALSPGHLPLFQRCAATADAARRYASTLQLWSGSRQTFLPLPLKGFRGMSVALPSSLHRQSSIRRDHAGVRRLCPNDSPVSS